jgi:hypothetical protein
MPRGIIMDIVESLVTGIGLGIIVAMIVAVAQLARISA